MASAVSLEPSHCHSVAPWTLCGLLQPHCSRPHFCPSGCTAVPRQHAPPKQKTYGVFCSQLYWASVLHCDPVLGKSRLPLALEDASPSCSSATAQCPRPHHYNSSSEERTSESYFRLPWAPSTHMACRHSGKTQTHKINKN